MIKTGIAQVKNSTALHSNYKNIQRCLSIFESADVDLVLFPECALSGFSSKAMDCTFDAICPYLNDIGNWSKKMDIAVILPTVLNDKDIYNTGYFFHSGQIDQFYKIGLTESEKGFFSTPTGYKKKIYEVCGYKFVPLICMEAQLEPYTYFSDGSVDFILWPAYWGWDQEDQWTSRKKDGGMNLVYKNMTEWSVPIIQANFAFNDIGNDRSKGPNGLSVVIDEKNNLYFRASFEKQVCFVVEINSHGVSNCYSIASF